MQNVSALFYFVSRKIPSQLVLLGQTILILVLIFSFPVIYLTLRNSKKNDSQASVSTGAVTLALSPGTTQLIPNSVQTIDLMVNTSQEKVDGVQAIIVFTGTLPPDLSFTPTSVPGLNPIVSTIETLSSGKKASLAFITSNPTEPFTTNASLVKLGTFSFTAPGDGQLTAAFNTQLTTSLKNGTTEGVLKTPEDSTYTFAFVSNEARPKLYFNTLTPPNPQQVGQPFEVNIMASSADQQVSGVDAQITFDPNVVEITGIVESAESPFPSYPELTHDNSSGKIFVSANIGTAANPIPASGPAISIAKITGRTKVATNSTTLQYIYNINDRNDSNIVSFISVQGQEPADILAKVENQEIVSGQVSPSPILSQEPSASPTPSPTPTSQPSATPTPSTAPDVTSTLVFGLQGKNRPDANKAVQLSVEAKFLQNNTVSTKIVTTSSNGQAEMTLSPGDYEFKIDAPGYLVRKLGTVTDPVRITGNNAIVDLSGTPLFGGDFNNDDEINEIDYTLHFLTSFRESNTTVDLDSSGTVNNLDFSIMRSNWGQESDE